MCQRWLLTGLLSASLLGGGSRVIGQPIQMHPELPRSGSEKTLLQTVLFEMPKRLKGTIHLQAYQWRSEQDSVLIYAMETAQQSFSTGASAKTWKLDTHLKRCKVDPGFEDIVKRFGTLPPGKYHLYLELDTDEAATPYRVSAQYALDSTLGIGTGLRNRLNQAFGAGTKNAELMLQQQGALKREGMEPKVETGSETASRKARRSLRGVNGIDTRTVRHAGVLQSELYYDGWFLGRYVLADTRAMTAKAQEEYNALKGNAASKVQNELEGFRSVGSQVRDLYAAGENKELRGDIDLNLFSATGRDPYSTLDPTYAEVHGTFNTEIKGIPVEVEGYYTTQDAHREAAASYFRFRYDVETAKDKLTKLITGYRSKFSETTAKGAGLEQVYGQYGENLKGQAAKLLTSASREYGIDESVLQNGAISTEALQASLARKMDTTGLIQRATAKAKSNIEADSSSTAIRERYAKAQQKLLKSEADIRKLQQQYQALQQTIEKYSTLLEQYSKQVHLDSALTYAKVEKLRGQDVSYKDMAKAAEGLLPDGKVKRLVTGLTHLEGGILDRYESEYTLAGQTIKGVSGGYDVGFATVGLTAGYTEYINREGSLDRYLGYLGRVDLKEYYGQKFGFVYYGYSPTRQVLRSSNFLGNIDAAYPTFARPVYVLALTHAGTFGRDLKWQTEAAASLQQGTAQQTIGMANSALKTAAEYAIPKTDVRLKGEWEHLGKDFENRSLPLARAGTERYTAGVDGDFFRNFLHLGVTINYLEQHNLTSVGYSTRWGLELRTKSKRYPNVQLSYKPFSTFRAVSDTLAVAQRPLFGEVWVVRGSYQLKHKGGISHRFTLSYNQNSTTNDTTSYRSVTAQASYLYASRDWMFGLNGGWMQLPTITLDGYSTGSSCFAGINAARMLGRVSATASQELAIAPFGLQRLSTTAGASYRFIKQPFTLRMTLRYTHFRQDAASTAGNLLAAQLGFGWRFALPLSDKPDKL